MLQLDKVEELRLIIEREQNRVVEVEEATEAADALISFFQLLAEVRENQNVTAGSAA